MSSEEGRQQNLDGTPSCEYRAGSLLYPDKDILGRFALHWQPDALIFEDSHPFEVWYISIESNV
jgi:hypothetical protein